ncbi:ubiquitin carboxyl-terminal hydrolase-domain-containing protein [Lipomyces oligophaga]|uniref:ubiquitin carboxyl-terminal hydrolase-domain-containing protein n=1 Tax=Lipomyces oligophaga TaxID=45792 RepID=UPI0034CDC224
MFKSKRDRSKDAKELTGLAYYLQHGLKFSSLELIEPTAKVIKLLEGIGIVCSTENAKLVVRSLYASGNVEKAAELYKFYNEARDGVLLSIQECPLSGLSSQWSYSFSHTSPICVNFGVSSSSDSDSVSPHGSRSSSISKSYPSQQKSDSDMFLQLPNKTPKTLMPMQGAENLKGVTCYLDSLLFAMYARLESFEPILCQIPADDPLRSLATIIRLWVNLLRAGKLITTDVTAQLRICLAQNGWEEAGKDRQQDTSEAFVFLAEKLAMPLLTLKMDIQHGGKEAAKDDHKLINERLLNVPIQGGSEDSPIRLEVCLEDYFSDSVVVRREIERRRSLSISSIMKGAVSYVEYADVPSGRTQRSGTIDARPEVLERLSSSSSVQSLTRLRKSPELLDHGTPMISASDETAISDTATVSTSDGPEQISSFRSSLLESKPQSIGRRSTIRTINNEISLPAWTFLQILPFYANADLNIKSVHHFTQQRPVLPICLKRYTWSSEGKAQKNDRKIIIPEVIEFPHFVADDLDSDGTEGDALFGNFRLILESVVFHRGSSVNSGHYVSAVRDSLFKSRMDIMQRHSSSVYSDESDEEVISADAELATDRWLFFDDLASNRIISRSYQDIMDKEMPYLLFYRLVHINDTTEEACSQNEFMDIADSFAKQSISPVSTSSSIATTYSFQTSAGSETETVAFNLKGETYIDEELKSKPATRLGFIDSKSPTIATTPATDGTATSAHSDVNTAAASTSAVHSSPTTTTGSEKSDFSRHTSRSRWRDRNISRKQSAVSVPDNFENPLPQLHQHHHRHFRRRHRTSSQKNNTSSKTSLADDGEVEDRCTVM